VREVLIYLFFFDQQHVLDPGHLDHDDTNQGEGNQYGDERKNFLHARLQKYTGHQGPGMIRGLLTKVYDLFPVAIPR
jgi:hypothetical protein